MAGAYSTPFEGAQKTMTLRQQKKISNGSEGVGLFLCRGRHVCALCRVQRIRERAPGVDLSRAKADASVEHASVH